MRISISIKWTLSAVLIVILVVIVYAYFMSSDTQKSVEAETDRIRTIQYEALDQIGSQTTRYISLPASSLLYDNDIQGLTNLLSPVVAKNAENTSYFAIYSMIIDPNGSVWTAAVNNGYDKLEFADIDFFDRKREEQTVKEISERWLKQNLTSKTFPLTEDVKRTLTSTKGEKVQVNIRQYVHEIEDKGEKQGYLIIGYSMDGLTAEIDKIREQGEVRKDEAIHRAISLAIIAVIIGLVIAGIQAILVTRNIKILSKAANQIASGDLSVRSNIKTRDEIGQLGDQFNVMADRVQALLMETEQKAMLEKEVDIARSIQTTLLPPAGFAQCGPVTLNGYFQPASVCGGDFWSYNRLPDGSILLTMGDVTGHGVPSAMITACAKSALDTLLNISSTQLINMPQLVTSLNAAICQTAKRTLFMTFIAMRITPDARYAEVVNAGHNFPLHIRNGEVRGIVARGERLGDNPNARYEQIRVDIAHGDMFLFYTDGLTEYIGPQGNEYGEKRLRKIIAPCGAGDVNHAMQHLQADFNAFCGNAPQADDITLMFAKV